MKKQKKMTIYILSCSGYQNFADFACPMARVG